MNYLDGYTSIQSSIDRRVLTLTLNRPTLLNAVNAPMRRELSTIFAEINLDPDVDIVVLTGAGRAFSAGGDTRWMTDLISVDGEWQRKAVESRRIWLSLLDLEKPLICKLNGLVRGMSTTIASLCDVVIASDLATTADTHLNMALGAADGCNANLAVQGRIREDKGPAFQRWRPERAGGQGAWSRSIRRGAR
jgi:enoyl-CoA hydratase